jgi:hypothetical protein
MLRQKLKISSNLIHTEVKDFDFMINQSDVLNYNDAVKIDNVLKINIHPLFYTKISWQIINSLNHFFFKPFYTLLQKEF